MKITRSRTITTPGGSSTFTIELTQEDLTREERVEELRAHWLSLLDLQAEEYIMNAMFKAKAFHRKTEKNQRLAMEERTRIEILRTGIMRIAR